MFVTIIDIVEKSNSIFLTFEEIMEDKMTYHGCWNIETRVQNER